MKIKRAAWIALTALLLIAGVGVYADGSYATCTGSDPCHACSNCSHCRHCAREGGHCGVCKRHGTLKLEGVKP